MKAEYRVIKMELDQPSPILGSTKVETHRTWIGLVVFFDDDTVHFFSDDDENMLFSCRGNDLLPMKLELMAEATKKEPVMLPKRAIQSAEHITMRGY